MSYSYQNFSFGQVLTSAQMQQVEDNIRDHVHGQDGVSDAILAGSISAYVGVGTVAPTGYLFCDGSAISRVTYAALFAKLYKSATITVTIASPGVVSWTAHGLQANDPVKFTNTGGALPTGITAGTTYYVITAGLATDSFRIAASPGGAAINTTGSQSGTHTGIHAPYGDGDGSTTFNVPDLRGRVLGGRDDLGGTAASRLTSAGMTVNGNFLGATGGAQTTSIAVTNLPASGPQSSNAASTAQTSVTDNAKSQVNVATGASASITLGGGTALTNLPPIITINWIIKT